MAEVVAIEPVVALDSAAGMPQLEGKRQAPGAGAEEAQPQTMPPHKLSPPAAFFQAAADRCAASVLLSLVLALLPFVLAAGLAPLLLDLGMETRAEELWMSVGSKPLHPIRSRATAPSSSWKGARARW